MRVFGLASLSCLLCFAGVLAAPPLVPKSPVIAKVNDRPAVVQVTVPADGEFAAAPAFAPEDCLWFGGETNKGVKSYLVQPYRAGVYRVVFWTKGEVEYATLVIDASDGQPTPDIKPEPRPDIKPTPPEPPKDIPFPGVTGLHVLIVIETGDLSKYPASVQSVLYGKQTREWLDANCASLPGGRKAWNIWDKDVDASSMGAAWVDALKRKRDSLPWLIASNGKTAIEIPLPKTPSEFIEKVGGVK